MIRLIAVLLFFASLAIPDLAKAQLESCLPGFCGAPPIGLCGGPAFATLDGVPVNTTLSGGNLTATHSNSTPGGARTASVKLSARCYFEVTVSNLNNLFSGIELLKSTSTYADGGSLLSETVLVVGNGGILPFGEILANTGQSGCALGAITGTVTIGVAVVLQPSPGSPQIWFRLGAAGPWNGNCAGDPALNTGGVTLSGATQSGTVTAGPTCLFEGDSTETCTVNFGASPFIGVVPTGFAQGWLQ